MAGARRDIGVSRARWRRWRCFGLVAAGRRAPRRNGGDSATPTALNTPHAQRLMPKRSRSRLTIGSSGCRAVGMPVPGSRLTTGRMAPLGVKEDAPR